MSTVLTTLNIVNPGFETGNMTGWTVSDPSVTAYGLTTVPFPGDDPPRTGSWAMRGGTVADSWAWQTFDVSAYATFIDADTCTLQGFTAYQAVYDPQPDQGALELYFYDGLGAQLALYGAGNASPGGWHFVDLGTKAVPVGTRSIRLGVHNDRLSGAGTNNDCYWDDFTSPNLITPIDIGVTHTASAALSLSVSMTAMAALITFAQTHTAAAEFRLSLSFRATARKYPEFECPAPTPKVWDRRTIVAKAWACVTVVPAEECDGAEASNDDLELVSGDRLVTLDGYGLKLVS